MPDVSLAKLIHNFSVGGKDSESVFHKMLPSACKALSMDVVIPPESVNVRVHFPLKVFGFWWEPEGFVSKALQVNHPLAAESVVPHDYCLKKWKFKYRQNHLRLPNDAWSLLQSGHLVQKR